LTVNGLVGLVDDGNTLASPHSLIIEDYVTQVGQGGIRERGPEMLAQTDVKTILLRKIWLREITSHAGRPPYETVENTDRPANAQHGLK
jgi:hypothetical protein